MVCFCAEETMMSRNFDEYDICKTNKIHVEKDFYPKRTNEQDAQNTTRRQHVDLHNLNLYCSVHLWLQCHVPLFVTFEMQTLNQIMALLSCYSSMPNVHQSNFLNHSTIIDHDNPRGNDLKLHKC